MPYTDFLFGNEYEVAALGKVKGWGDNLQEIAKQASLLPKENSSRPRTVVCTHGAEDVIVAINGEVQLFPVPKMAKEEIVDTNGAGDSFVGGFLAYLVKVPHTRDCSAVYIHCSSVAGFCVCACVRSL